MSREAYRLVSIVVLNYNGKEMLERCVSSLINQTYPNFEIIFVDNSSTDGSVEFIKQKYGANPKLKIVVNDRNYGPVEGNNIGARLATGEYIVFLNNDTETERNCLSRLVNVLESDITIGAAGCKQLLMEDPKRLQGIGSFVDIYGFSYLEGEGEKDVGQYDRTIEIFSGGTTALIVRKEVLSKVGFLDSKFVYGLDDVDLCWRIWLSGYRIVYVPDARVYHLVGSTSKKIPAQHLLLHREKNRMAMLVKCYDLGSQLKVIPVVLFIDLITILVFLIHQKTSYAKAVINALLWDLTNADYIWDQHAKVKWQRKISDKEIMECMKKTNFMDLWHRLRTQKLIS